MRVRAPVAVALLFLLSAFQSTRFDGCGGGGRPPAPLPPSDEPTCISDADCPIEACEDRRCLGGVCTVVSSLVDRDGDGDGPPSCGTDCDDTDGTVGPGEDELCDGRDQDCDLVVDEDAPPAAVRRTLGLSDTRVHAAAFGTGLVVLETGLVEGLSAISLDFLGTAGSTVELETGEDPDLYDVAPSDEGAVAVVLHSSTGLLEGIPLTVGPGGDPEVGARFPIASGLVDVLELRAFGLPIDGTLVLAVAFRDSAGDAMVWADGFAAPVLVAPASSVPTDVATDGTAIVVTRGANEALFLGPTGTVMSTQTVAPSTWASDPIDSGDGRVFAVVTDAFDASLTSFTDATVAALRSAPSAVVRSMPSRLDTGPRFHVLTRLQDDFSASGVWAWALDPVSLAPVSTFTRDEVSGSLPMGAVTDYDVVVSEHGAAVITALGASGTAVTTFACGAGG